MSLVDIRIELPAYSHSFTVQVPPSSSIRDVKGEITKACPGAPRSEGQRLVWKGRFLTDEEKVEDIWKSPDDSRILHLAVHPSGWTSAPPATPSSQVNDASSQTYVSSQRQYPSTLPPTATNPPHLSPLLYVILRHNAALTVMMSGTTPAPVPQQLRQAAVEWFRYHGWSWPSVFDQEFPPSGAVGEGVKYESVTIENMLYAKLTNPSATPTPTQLHALKVLSHTYPILTHALSFPDPHTLPPPSNYAYAYPMAVPYTNLNHHLQQLGLPQLRVAPGQPLDPNNPNRLPAPVAAEIRAIPLRALLVPLVMLIFRTLLVIYFFSPSKRPWFGIIISMWILYEAWGALRVVLGDERGRPGMVGAAQRDANGAGAEPNAPAGAQAAPGQPQPPRAGRNASQGPINMALNTLATMNLSAEDAAIDSAHPVPTPTLGHKVKTFVIMLLLTIHPAAWDRRRAVLRRREGRIRTEANAREAAQDGEVPDEARARAQMELVAKHERRPAWIREYIRRVQVTEWVDDA